MATVTNSCGLCGVHATSKCSSCESLYYCCKEHQMADWSRHSQVCRPIKLVESPVIGRHYVAVRDIKIGETIIKEKALLTCSNWTTLPVCIACFETLQKDKVRPCAKCEWLLCSSCREHGSECEFISAYRINKMLITEFDTTQKVGERSNVVNPLYEYINTIRVLSMKDANKATYDKFLSLDRHYDKIKKHKDMINMVSIIRRFFKLDDITDEEMIKITGILQCNAFVVPQKKLTHIGIYELTTFVEHNCRPNCSKMWTSTHDLVVQAAVPILQGCRLSICYVDSLLGTKDRNTNFYRRKHGYCDCERCKDPTEYGTMFSALKCSDTTCPGYALPETFLTAEPKSYVCCVCELPTNSENVKTILESVAKKIPDAKKKGVAGCDEFLTSYQNILHPNHFYNVNIMVALVEFLRVECLKLDNENLLVSRLELFKKLNNILETLAPGEIRIRGITVRLLGLAIMAQSNKYLSEADDLLKLEPDLAEDGKMARQIYQTLALRP